MTQYNVGERLRSRVSNAQLVVIKAEGDLKITCDGQALAQEGDQVEVATPSAGPAIEVGKRYESADESVELLVVAPGTGELAVDGTPMSLKVPKPLPASD